MKLDLQNMQVIHNEGQINVQMMVVDDDRVEAHAMLYNYSLLLLPVIIVMNDL